MSTSPKSLGLIVLFAVLLSGLGFQSSPEKEAEASAPRQASSRPSNKLAKSEYLVVNYEESKVALLDKNGEVLWHLEELFYPADAQWLPNGSILICEQADHAVREYSLEREITRDKRIIWDYGDKNGMSQPFRPYHAQRLDNGNTLITDYEGKRVIEVNAKKKTVWQYPGQYIDAERLAS